VNDSFLVERLRDKLLEIERGESTFNARHAEGVLTNCAEHVAVVPVPDVVFLTHEKPLNAQQRRVVCQAAGSSLVYVWGPPGTGKTSTLGAVVHAFHIQGKSVLLCVARRVTCVARRGRNRPGSGGMPLLVRL